MRVHVADHQLISHKLTYLRDRRTDSPTFRRLAEELVTLLAYEATRDVRVEPFRIETPVAPTMGIKLANPKPLVVPILRAGLGHARRHGPPAAQRRGRVPRDDAQRGDPRSSDLRQPAARRPVRPAVLRPGPDAGHRRHARRRHPLPRRAGRRRHHRHHPHRRTRGHRPPRAGPGRAPRPARLSSLAPSTSGSTSAGTSCPGSATPATGSTGWSDPSLRSTGRARPARHFSTTGHLWHTGPTGVPWAHPSPSPVRTRSRPP